MLPNSPKSITKKPRDKSPRVLHIANWFPNPWNDLEGLFVRDQIELFNEVANSSTIVVQVRNHTNNRLIFRQVDLGSDAQGHYLFTKFKSGLATRILTTTLLLIALTKIRFWKFDVLHFHIAYPLLSYPSFLRFILRRPMLVSEHWSAYHFNFYLPSDSKSLAPLRRPFSSRIPVLAVSQALLNDIYRFSCRDDFKGYIVPNTFPLHGYSEKLNTVPILFAVNCWTEIKNPIPMLEGLILATQSGSRFHLVLGGYGPLYTTMKAKVQDSSLAMCTTVFEKMTKPQIAEQLARADGYLFSSHYETFSIACAEALGAGVPLLGPEIPAIAEYATTDDWFEVEHGDAKSWEAAIEGFLRALNSGKYRGHDIAERAAKRFSKSAVQSAYRTALMETLPERDSH